MGKYLRNTGLQIEKFAGVGPVKLDEDVTPRTSQARAYQENEVGSRA